MQSRKAPWLLLSLLPFAAATALGDPLRVEVVAKAQAPKRPELRLSAESAITDLQMRLRPEKPPSQDGSGPGAEHPETSPQEIRLPKLTPGPARTVSVGTGRPGRTLWVANFSYKAQAGKTYQGELRFDTVVNVPLKISYDGRIPGDHFSLKGRYVDIQVSHRAERAEISVIGEDGTEIGSGQVRFADGRPGTWLRVPWNEKQPGSNVLRLVLKIYDEGGLPHQLQLSPWQVAVPHEEVTFTTGSSAIDKGEAGKLDEALGRIRGILSRVKDHAAPKLYVAGHTDTVGTDADNLTLSLSRARAIAGYFQSHNLGVPVLYAGFGERVPKVATNDNVDEAQNRRCDYILALDPPRIGQAPWHAITP